MIYYITLQIRTSGMRMYEALTGVRSPMLHKWSKR